MEIWLVAWSFLVVDSSNAFIQSGVWKPGKRVRSELWAGAGVVVARCRCPRLSFSSVVFFIINWGGSWGSLGLPPVGEAQEPFLFHVCLSPPSMRHQDPTRKHSWSRPWRAWEPQGPAKGLGSLAVCPAGWLMPFRSFRSNAGWCINGELSQCRARYWEAGTSRPPEWQCCVTNGWPPRPRHPTKPCVCCKARLLPSWHTHLILSCRSADLPQHWHLQTLNLLLDHLMLFSIFFFPPSGFH